MWHILRRELRESSQIDVERCTYFLYSFTLDTISRLDRDTTTALTTIREWRNTFAPINRVPVDILSLIPAHLSSQNDRFRATFVCRHWRRTLLEHGTLWSQMFLKKGWGYTKTLLKRARGSLLEISIDQDVPSSTIALLFPHSQQIGCLEFQRNYLMGIGKFSGVNPGPLPCLRTLKISWHGTDDDDQPFTATPPSSPFFSNAANVEEFIFDSTRFQLLNHFVFPNLTTFKLRTRGVARSRVPDLFDFLKASPMLRKVEIYVSIGIMLADIPREMVVILPNVETFSLTSSDENAYDVAVHISCPRARDVSLISEVIDLHIPSTGWEIFPTSVLWNTIIHHYTRSPAEEATLEMRPLCDPFSLTFQSSDASTVRFAFELILLSDNEDELDIGYGEIFSEAFSQGLGIIQTHPLLRNVKRFHIICRDSGSINFQTLLTATGIEGVFGSVGPLDTLTLSGCDLHPYLAGFGKVDVSEKQIAFPC